MNLPTSALTGARLTWAATIGPALLGVTAFTRNAGIGADPGLAAF